eukprot:764996-Hanusia_phi.AAC.4
MAMSEAKMYEPSSADRSPLRTRPRAGDSVCPAPAPTHGEAAKERASSLDCGSWRHTLRRRREARRRVGQNAMRCAGAAG